MALLLLLKALNVGLNPAAILHSKLTRNLHENLITGGVMNQSGFKCQSNAK